MTPEQQSYASLWLSELWSPVPEWHATRDEQRAAADRNNRLGETRGEPELPYGAVA